MTDQENLDQLIGLGVFNPNKFGDESDIAVFEDGVLVGISFHIGWRTELGEEVEEILSSCSHLRSVQLGGQLKAIPEFIYDLEELVQLDLSYNVLMEIPSRISQLENLEELILLGNLIRELPKEICQLRRLRVIEMQKNHLERVDPLALTHGGLTHLDLSENYLEEIPPINCRSLEYCNLAYNSLKSPVDVSRLENVATLDLSYNKISELVIGDNLFSKCQELILSNNHLEEYPVISESTNLIKLDLSDNQIQTIPRLSIKSLQQLNLGMNLLTEFASSDHHLPSLEYLNLQRNSLKRVSIVDQTKLRNLVLRGNQLSEMQITGLPELTMVDISENNLTRIPGFVFELKTLTHLLAEDNIISRIPEEICELKDLYGLWIGRNQIKTLPDEIMHLKYLDTLWLDYNLLESLPERIGDLGLSRLSIYHNRLKVLPHSILELKEVSILNLTNNLFEELEMIFLTASHFKYIQLEDNPLSDTFKEKVAALERLGTLSSKIMM